MTNDIMVNGKPVKLACTVVRDPKLQFKALGKRTETRAVVLHQTGGEGGGEGIFNTLQGRNLHVQFAIDQKGVVYQYADAAARCSHAGEANGFSVGIEIANRANGEPAHPKFPRDMITGSLRGKTVKYTDFYIVQYMSAYALTAKLCEAFGLPMLCPVGKDGKVLKETLSQDELRSVRGVIGHYHITTRKVDPYAEILQYLMDKKS